MNLNLNAILMLSADTPATLRPPDVDRVMTAAKDLGCLEEFKSWILAKTDLLPRTRKTIEDWTEE